MLKPIQSLDAMCKDMILANMSWLELDGRKKELNDWFKQPGHGTTHPDFHTNNRMYSEICTEIYKRNLQIELHEC